jgi:hypothetical protein
MEDFQERVVVEHQELTEKIERLEKFLESHVYAVRLGELEKTLLRNQLSHMRSYADILARRIALWGLP